MLNRLHIDSEFAFETVRGIPQAVSEGVLREWEGRKHVPLETPKGRRINPHRGVMGIHVPDDRPRNANIWLRHISETIRGLGLPRHVLIDENDITAKAKALARRVGWMCRNGASLVEVQALARLYAVDLPDPGKAPHTEQSVWLRASNPVWWRRQIRKASHRTLERGAIIAGRVHNRAGLYASDDAVKRLAARKRQSRELLAMTQVINELGQSYTLEELAALSTSNPLIRRAELMVRLRGFEQYAKEEGHVCDFITLTCPGSYHPRLSKTGEPNPGYNPQFGPRESQLHLRTVWARARAKLARAGVRMYGFRVAEPHHDGTPHWHMVLFFEGQHRRIVRKVMRHYALQVEPTQPGAWRRRCTFKTIDLVNGSACGYVAKYIAKNVDGRSADGSDLSHFDHESNPTDPQLFSESAFRVEAWAKWGIRQFQQIGAVPVTVWRELRRLHVEDERPELADLITAADSSDWCQYLRLMGGATAKRADLAAHTYREPVTNQYGEESAVIRGVDGFGVVAISRIHEWTVQPASEAATADGAGRRDDGQRDGGVSRSWTRVNNCTATGQSRADYRESLLDEVEVFDDFHTESSFIFHPPGWIQ